MKYIIILTKVTFKCNVFLELSPKRPVELIYFEK